MNNISYLTEKLINLVADSIHSLSYLQYIYAKFYPNTTNSFETVYNNILHNNLHILRNFRNSIYNQQNIKEELPIIVCKFEALTRQISIHKRFMLVRILCSQFLIRLFKFSWVTIQYSLERVSEID